MVKEKVQKPKKNQKTMVADPDASAEPTNVFVAMAALTIQEKSDVVEEETPEPIIDTNETESIDTNTNDTSNVKVSKKRGRKPKGGKIIITANVLPTEVLPEPNIILHLKCKETDLMAAANAVNTVEQPVEIVETFQFENNHNLSFEVIRQPGSTSKIASIKTSNDKLYNHVEKNYPDAEVVDTNNIHAEKHTNQYLDHNENDNDSSERSNARVIAKKIKELTYNLHNNDILGKKSACFWCTCDFDNPPIFIPKHEINHTYHCYGCFCSPECATAFLFKEAIDTSTRFERYHLLNHVYCKIYNYKKNIKPAPDPLYTLQKFYGNLSIQEYRKMLKNERLLLVVDKPLSRTLPELHEDNDDFLFSSGRTIPASASSNSTTTATSFKLRKKPKQSKTEIVSENFNLK